MCTTLTFDISVDFLFRVQILESFQDLSQNCGNLCFIQGTWFQLEEQIHYRVQVTLNDGKDFTYL